MPNRSRTGHDRIGVYIKALHGGCPSPPASTNARCNASASSGVSTWSTISTFVGAPARPRRSASHPLPIGQPRVPAPST